MDKLDIFRTTVNEWLAFKLTSEGRSSSTCEKYRGYMERVLEFSVARGVDPFGIDEGVLVEFTGMHLHKEGLTPSSRRAVIAAVKGFYAYIQKKGVIPTNPSLDLVYPSKARLVPIAMQLHNAERMLMQPDIGELIGARDVAMMALLAGTGIRVSGLVGLNESAFVRFQDGSGDRLGLRISEKGGHERIVPVPRESEMLLFVYLGHPEIDSIDRLLPDGDKVLFVSFNNRTIPECDYRGEVRRLSARSVLRAMQKHAKAAGIPLAEAHPHALRHLLGTEMAESELSTLAIQTQLGHVDANATKIYAQMALRKRTEQLDRSNPLSKISTPVTPLLNNLRSSRV